MLRFVSGNQSESPVTASDYVASGAYAIISNPDRGMQRNGESLSVRFDRLNGLELPKNLVKTLSRDRFPRFVADDRRVRRLGRFGGSR